MNQANFLFLCSQEKYNDVASELIVHTYFFSAAEEVFPEVASSPFTPRLGVTHVFCLAVAHEYF